jgi:N-methylhydantoinase B
MPRTVDPITTEVIGNLLMSVAEEMATTLEKTAFSPNIKARGDCSTAIFDRHGNVVAQAYRIPAHLGSMLGLLAEVTKRIPIETVRPGDAFIANDPYSGGGQHLPDISVLSPVFHEGALFAWVASLGHHADIGGMVVGSESADCQSIFQEGLRIPPVRIVAEGVVQDDMLNLILLNTRTPWERRGDLHAQFAANHVGVAGIHDVLERIKAPVLVEAMAELLEYAERRIRAGIRKIPDGRYAHADQLDSDGRGSGPLRIALTVEVKGDEIHLDFTGTADQVGSSKNATLSSTLATVYTVLKSMIDPDLPANSGYFRAIRVTVPEGSILNAQPPAAVSSRVYPCLILGDVVVGAMSQALPERAMAACGPSHQITTSGLKPDGRASFVNYEHLAGALGARPYQDGMDAVRAHASGAGNLPVEVVESHFPVLIERYELRADSGGPGRFRGGLGIRRDYRMLGLEPRIVATSERQLFASRGIVGGGDGRRGVFTLNPDTPDARVLPGVVSDMIVEEGSVVRVETPGGGGYGDPLTRDRSLVLQDLREGRIGQESAENDYGLVRADVSEPAIAAAR